MSKVVAIDLDKVIPEMIQLCVDIHGSGIPHTDAVRIAELLEDAAIEDCIIRYRLNFKGFYD